MILSINYIVYVQLLCDIKGFVSNITCKNTTSSQKHKGERISIQFPYRAQCKPKYTLLVCYICQVDCTCLHQRQEVVIKKRGGEVPNDVSC